MKICVVGTRGFPETQGGVEKHCEILFENVDYLTRKCATWPDHFLYTESTNHPEHPCATLRPGRPAVAAAWDIHLIFVQEAIT